MMTPEQIQQVFKFGVMLDKLKAITRKTKPVGLDRYENSAEHSWQICVMACLFASESKLEINIDRVVELLLVHDIPEIEVGDQIVYAGKSAAQADAEREGARRLFSTLPESQAKWAFARWEEFETRQSNEAIYAYAIDRMMPILQNLQNGANSWRENNVALQQILTFNAPIGVPLPAVWAELSAMVQRFADETPLAHWG
jgi:putative hydrolases of HD superfamily